MIPVWGFLFLLQKEIHAITIPAIQFNSATDSRIATRNEVGLTLDSPVGPRTDSSLEASRC